MSYANQPLGANGNGDGRRADGTFAPGHGHAKGPRKTRGQKLRAAVLKAATKEDFVAIFQRAVDDAKKGDAQARQWVFDRVLGKVADSDLREQVEQLKELFRRNGGVIR